jgi:serine/threonine-protein kinase HipA
MNRCILCGKKVEGQDDYHRACLKKLFSVPYWPGIGLTLREVSIEAQKMAGKLSVSGVQPKLSMRLNLATRELEVVTKGGEHILKPQIATFPNIPQNENLCMNIALNLGITVPPHSLVRLKDGSWAYIVKRFDRIEGRKLHQEDFYQILGERDKYSGSLERIGNRLREISEIPGLDVQLFFERILLFFVIGNGDAHLKNFSIIYDENGRIRLSPAYDIVSSKLVIPEEEDLALPMNGKRNRITRKDFDRFAETLKIRTTVSYERILGNPDLIKGLIEDSQLNTEEKQRLSEIVWERFSRLDVRVSW